MRKKDIVRMLLLYSFLFVIIFYLELVFKMSILVVNFDQEFIFMLLFSFGYSFLILFFVMFFKPKTMQYLVFFIVLAISFLFFMQDIYHTIVENFYSIQIAGDFTLGLSFIGDAFLALEFKHLFYVLPIIGYVLLIKFYKSIFKADYRYLKQPLFVLIMASLTFSVATNMIDDSYVSGNIEYIYSERDLYDYVYDAQKTVKTFGLLTYVQRDIMNLFRTPPLRVNEYLVLLEDYLSSKPEQQSNAMTGIFEDKNFIMIMAESLDTYAIHETLTPHLFQLKQQAYFDRYYSPLYYRSTADTEFMSQLSLFPNKNVTLSMEAYMDNTFPNTFPRLFEQEGYKTFSYHNYIDYFYPRQAFHTQTLGFQVYKSASDLGLLNDVEPGTIIFNHKWQRDTDLISLTIDDFIDEDKFFVNYITVSGHFNYNSDHDVVGFHTDRLQQYLDENDMTLDSKIFYYLATAMELDAAVGLLMDALDEKGKLDDTIIMIYGDHYAYGIDEQIIWEYDTIKEDGNRFDIHRVPMLFHAPNTELQGTFQRYMSSIDILPTVSNLFGLNLNYRYVFGVDVFSERNAMIKFPDLSFMSKDFMYEALTESYTIVDDAITLEELKFLEQRIITDYRYNTMFLDYDYLKIRN